MAQIDSYSVDTDVEGSDRLLGYDSTGGLTTHNYTVESISNFVRGNIILTDISEITASAAELNILDGATLSTAELNVLNGFTGTTEELNVVDGLTATTTELNYSDGVTSNIQNQLDGKQSTITGGASTIATNDLTASRALISNADGKVAVSDVTGAELGYLDGVTSSIQTQIDGITEFEPSNTGSANQVLQRTSTGYQWANASNASFTLPTATSNTLGGVIVPLISDIDIDSAGNITLGNISANKITSGVVNIDRIPSIDDAKLTSVLNSDDSNAPDGYVLTSDGSGGVAWEAGGGGSGGHTILDDGTAVTNRTNLNFLSPITVNSVGSTDSIDIDITLAQEDIPNLAAAKITSGVFNSSRLSTDTPTDGQVLTYNDDTSSMEWTNKGSAAVVFGNEEGEVAEWAEGNNTDDIPVSKIPDLPFTQITGTATTAQIPDLAASKITSGTLDVGRLSSDTPTDNQILAYDSDSGTAVWEDAGAAYQLPIATSTTLGGVIVEDDSLIDIDSDGKLTLDNGIPLSYLSDSASNEGDFLVVDSSGNIVTTDEFTIEHDTHPTLVFRNTDATRSSGDGNQHTELIGNIDFKWFEYDLTTVSDYADIQIQANNFSDGNEYANVVFRARHDGNDITESNYMFYDGLDDRLSIQTDSIQFSNLVGGNNKVLGINNNGVLYVTDRDTTLTIASSTTLGGVKIPLTSEINVDSEGNLTLGNLSISASEVTSGVFDSSMIPVLDATANIDSTNGGTNATDGYVLTADGSGGVSWEDLPETEVQPASNTVLGGIKLYSSQSDNSLASQNRYRVQTSSDFAFVQVPETQPQWTDADSSITLDLYFDNSSPSDGDVVGEITLSGNDSLGNKNAYASISGVIEDLSDEHGQMNLSVMGFNNAIVIDRIATDINNFLRLSKHTGGDNTYLRTDSSGNVQVRDYETSGSWTCSNSNVTEENYVEQGSIVHLFGTASASVTNATGLPQDPAQDTVGINCSVDTDGNLTVTSSGAFQITYRF